MEEVRFFNFPNTQHLVVGGKSALEAIEVVVLEFFQKDVHPLHTHWSLASRC